MKWMLAFVAVLTAASAHAQLARNGAYFELGGSGIVGSFNYERRVAPQWYGRVGVITATESDSSDTNRVFVVPVTASWVSRPAANHHLEIGGGVTFLGGDRQGLFEDAGGDNGKFSTAVVSGILGYRYQKPGHGFQFRAAFTPLAGGGFLPWAGVSVGYAW